MAHPLSSEKEPSSKSSNNPAAGSTPLLRFHFLSLFPETFSPILNSSVLKRAQEKGLVEFNLVQIRDFATDKHHTVDDTPFGGGEGMVLRADVLFAAWQSVAHENSETILLSPQGEIFDQAQAKALAVAKRDLILVCGHYEGVDERFIELCVNREISVGDYVLTGGELPAMVLADAITRLIPGAVGNERSIAHDSLENGLLKYPQYTRPREFGGLSVPEILLSGDHAAISRYREAQMNERTQTKRPDLWKKIREPDEV